MPRRVITLFVRLERRAAYHEFRFRNKGEAHDTLCDDDHCSGAFGLRTCLCTSFTRASAAWRDVSAWRRFRFAGPTHPYPPGRNGTRIAGGEPAGIGRIPAGPVNGYQLRLQWHWGFDSGVVIRPGNFGHGVRNGHFIAKRGKFVVRHGKFNGRDILRDRRFNSWDFDVHHGV